MTKQKSTPAATPADGGTTFSPTDAVARAEVDKEAGKEVSVTTTGRVQVETQIKVEDFTEGGEAAPDIYSRTPDVEVTEIETQSGSKIKVESFI